MCFDYDEYAEFAREGVRAAKKARRCNECRGEIAPGERYHFATGKFDGAFFYHATCRRCRYDTIRVVEQELAHGCGWSEAWPPLGHLAEYLDESGMGQTAPADVPESFKVGDQPRQPTPA